MRPSLQDDLMMRMIAMSFTSNSKGKDEDLFDSKEMIDQSFVDTSKTAEKKSAELSAAKRKEGNNIYNSKNDHSPAECRDIHDLYCQSVTYAPANSEELALAYNNRSVFLHKIKKYDLSLIDIERALKITKSITLRSKLLCRKVDCLIEFDRNEAKKWVIAAKQTIDQIDYTNLKLRTKLEESLIHSMNLKQKRVITNPTDDIALPLPRLQPSKELPCASNSVELKYNETKGRHLIANRDIQSGEIIIIEKGYTTCPTLTQIHMVCSTCLNVAWIGIPCDCCPCVIFCSEDCKATAMELFHDIECYILAQLINQQFFNRNNHAFITLRTIAIALKENSHGGGIEYLLNENKSVQDCKDKRTKGFDGLVFDSNKFRTICSLSDSFQPSFSPSIWLSIVNMLKFINPNYNNTPSALKKYVPDRLSEKESSSLRKLMTTLFRKLDMNPFEYSSPNYCSCDAPELAMVHDEKCFRNLGLITPSLCSLINHSCVPNISKIFRDGNIIIYTVRPIKKNEELCISYGPDTFTPKSLRDKYFATGYNFQCSCIACKKNWPTKEPYPSQEGLKAKLIFYQWMQSMKDDLERRGSHGKVNDVEDAKYIANALRKKINQLYAQNSLYKAEMLYYYFIENLNLAYADFYGTLIQMPDIRCSAKCNDSP